MKNVKYVCLAIIAVPILLFMFFVVMPVDYAVYRVRNKGKDFDDYWTDRGGER